MSFEDFALGNVDKQRGAREQLHPTIERMHTRADSILNDPEYAIQAPEFAGLYTKEAVLEDMRKVKEAENRFAKGAESEYNKNTEKVAKVFEAVMLTQGDKSASDWFAGASLLKTSRFDDYFNHTDLIAEWHQETSDPHILALAVDVTFGKHSVRKKMELIRKEIDRGQLGSIKYFKTKDGTFMGKRSNIPRVIVGADHPTVQQLAALWEHEDTDRLRSHGIQLGLIKEIAHQLSAARDYAYHTGNKKIADSYDRSIGITNRIAQAKNTVELGEMVNDKVYKEILAQATETYGKS